MEKHGGLPQPTSSKWVLEGDYANTNRKLETPTGKTFDVITVEGENKNDYYVIEIANWVAIAGDAPDLGRCQNVKALAFSNLPHHQLIEYGRLICRF